MVHPSVPVHTVKELITYAKTPAAKLNYGSSGAGRADHLAGVIFSRAAGITMQHIPYKGGAPAMVDLLAGNIDIMFGNLPDFMPQIRAGRLKAYGTTFLHRVPQANDIPTIAEQGYPGFETDSWYGIVAPVATGKDAVARMNAEFNRGLADPALRSTLVERGLEPLGGTPEQFGAHIRSEIAKYAQIVKVAKIRID